MRGTTLLGPGPGDPNKRTREARDVLSSAGEIWLRMRQHPTLNRISSGAELQSFDELPKSDRSQRRRADTG